MDPRTGRDRGDPSSRPTGLYAKVSQAPSSGRLRVIVPSYSRTRQSDPARYVAPAGEPVVGDECLVIFDDRGNPWALFAGVPA